MQRGFLVALVLGCLALGANAQRCTGIVEVATEAGLTVLLDALTAAGLVDAVTAEGAELTVFAPSNEAFTAALEALGVSADDLFANTELLTEILLYHVLPGTFPAAILTEGGEFATLLGADSSCGVGSVKAQPIDGGLSIVGGETTAGVTLADVETCTAIVHVIDTVLLPCPIGAPAPTPPAPMMPSPKPPMMPPMMLKEEECKDVVTTATEAGLTILLQAVEAAGLVETVNDPDAKLTIFAPTDEAFLAALKALNITAEDLLGDTELLTEILTYHVLGSPFTAADFAKYPHGARFKTLLGDDSSCGVGTLKIFPTREGGVSIVGGETSASVVVADVKACSTIVHVIDTVLLPCPITDEMKSAGKRVFFVVRRPGYRIHVG